MAEEMKRRMLEQEVALKNENLQLETIMHEKKSQIRELEYQRARMSQQVVSLADILPVHPEEQVSADILRVHPGEQVSVPVHPGEQVSADILRVHPGEQVSVPVHPGEQLSVPVHPRHGEQLLVDHPGMYN